MAALWWLQNLLPSDKVSGEALILDEIIDCPVQYQMEIFMAPGGRKSNRVNSNPFAAPRPGGKSTNKARLDYLMPGTINANTVRKLGTQDGTDSSELSGGVSNVNANMIQMPAVQDGINISGSGGRSTKAQLDFGVHDTQGRTTSSGPVSKRSNTYVNPIHTPTTQNTSIGPGGKKSTTDANPILMPVTQNKNTSSGVRGSTISSNPFPMPHMNDRIASFGPGPGGKRSFTDANPNLMPLTQGKNTCTGARKSTISPFPMPHNNDRETSFGKRSKTDADTTLMPSTHDKNTSAGGRGSHVNVNHVSDGGISTNNDNSFLTPNTQDGATTSDFTMDSRRITLI